MSSPRRAFYLGERRSIPAFFALQRNCLRNCGILSFGMIVGIPRLLVACLAFFFASIPSFAAQAPQADAAFPRGVVIPSVACADKAEQTYALYLPSQYTPDRRWPVIFAFDPSARGRAPVELLHEAAEKYGYVVAGSNNSRNDSFSRSIEAADAMMRDVSRRFSLDLRRLYVTGFSGGARVATLIALSCKGCVAGVFAHGAGFPPSREPPGKPQFVYFAAIGDLDFNYYELLELEQQLEAQGVPNRVRRYSGPHRWAPPEICSEALAWFDLQAMKRGLREKDAAFIAEQLVLARQETEKLEKAGDLYALWLHLHWFASDFDGLADASGFAARAAELKGSQAVRDGARRERAAIEEQRRIVAPIADSIDALSADPAGRSEMQMRLASQIAALNDQLKKNKDAAKDVILRRAHRELYAVATETGLQRMGEKKFPLAISLFEVSSALLPDAPFPFLLQARAYAASGKKKETLHALQQALDRKLPRESLAAYLRENSEFAAYRDLPEFQHLFGAASGKP
jgi:predicted esterase